jgi:hypothetical protein
LNKWLIFVFFFSTSHRGFMPQPFAFGSDSNHLKE